MREHGDETEDGVQRSGRERDEKADGIECGAFAGAVDKPPC